MLNFDLPKNQSSIIKVIGVGGGGSNAVSHMYLQGIQGVDFIICNTDGQAMEASPVPIKIQLGSKGLGAGSIPSVGKEAAIENIEDIKHLLEKNTKMLFITAGMGGGTGTGAAPIIAQTAKELGVLTVGIVTIPFSFEGRKRRLQAEDGIEELRKNVDTLLIISNDKLREVHGDLKLSEAFQKADNILTVAAKGIAEIITVTGYINVDFEDVKTVMKDSGTAIMGSAIAEGENRAITAVEEALASPLLNDNQIIGADNILLYIASGNAEITMDEVTEITEYIQNSAGQNAEIIWGNGKDETLENKISVTLVATGFKSEKDGKVIGKTERIVHPLVEIPKEEFRAKARITENITEITLLSSSKSGSNETESESDARQTRHETGNQSTMELKFKPAEKPAVNEIAPVIADEKKPEAEKPVKTSDNSETEQKNQPVKTEQDELEKKSMERIKRLKDLSMKLKSPSDIEEMENTPAYIRRNVDLSEMNLSSDSEVSRFMLSDGEDNSTRIKPNNSFLHDNVD